ncbi:MAG: hypothetical protein C4558_06325 [Dehalococcoidia bacterium]|nr:MAG: hypothetical protein C4558_06325 [Dehalococcoidia bacterium]
MNLTPAMSASAAPTCDLLLRSRVTDAYMRDPDKPSVARLAVGRPYPVATGVLVISSTRDQFSLRRYAVSHLAREPRDDTGRVLGQVFDCPQRAELFRRWLVEHWTPARGAA